MALLHAAHITQSHFVTSVCCFFFSTQTTDENLRSIALEMPNLKGLGVSMWTASSRGVEAYVNMVGANLTELHIEMDVVTQHYLEDGALAAIATRCSKLRALTFKT